MIRKEWEGRGSGSGLGPSVRPSVQSASPPAAAASKGIVRQIAVRRSRRNRDNCVTLPPALQSQSPSPPSVVKRHFEKCTSNDSYLAIMVPTWP